MSSKAEAERNTDRQYTLQLMRWIFKYLGVWSIVSTEADPIDRCLSFILIPFHMFTVISTIIPSIFHVILRVKDSSTIIVLLGPIGFSLSNMLKYCFIIYRSGSIKRCLEHMKADWDMVSTEDDRRRLLENAGFSRKLTQLCGTLMVTSDILYDAILPLFWGSTVDEFNITVRPLAYSGHDFYLDTQASPTYELLYVFCVVCGVVLVTITTAACSLAATLASHVFGQVSILESRLNSLVNRVDYFEMSATVEEQLSLIIQCHVRILKFTVCIEEVLREICFVEVIASTLIICLLEYYCVTEWSNSDTVAIITYIMLLISLSLNIYVFCYIGDKIQDKCESVGLSAYVSDWYEMSGNRAGPLIFTIAVANCPPQITAGGIMKLNIPNFGSIIKTSLAYLNVLRTVTE